MKFKVETRIIIVLIEVPKRNSTAPRTWNILVYVYATPGTELSHDESYSYIHIWADDKKGYTPPKTLTKKGTLLLVDREVFDVHVVAGINPTAQQDVCASMVHYSSYTHHYCIRTAKCPTACGTSTLSP